jgi:hypothetical protein
MMHIDGRNIPEPKRKKEFDPNVCTSKGCQNTRDLVDWADFGSKGKFRICPSCRAKAEPAVVTPPAAIEVVVGPQPPAELATVQADAEGLLEELKAFVVESNDDLHLAAEVLSDVKGKSKRLDEMEKSATRPLNESLKTIRAWFRPAKEGLLMIEQAIKSAIGRFELSQAEKRQAALAQLGGAASSSEAATALATLNEAQVSTVQGLSTRMVWDFVVTDANLVPREYLSVDESKLRHAVRAGARSIPGVSVFEKPQVASRST